MNFAPWKHGKMPWKDPQPEQSVLCCLTGIIWREIHSAQVKTWKSFYKCEHQLQLRAKQTCDPVNAVCKCWIFLENTNEMGI